MIRNFLEGQAILIANGGAQSNNRRAIPKCLRFSSSVDWMVGDFADTMPSSFMQLMRGPLQEPRAIPRMT